MKASAGIVLDNDVDEDDEDELLADVDAEAEVPVLDEGLDLDAIIDSDSPAMPSNVGGGFLRHFLPLYGVYKLGSI